MSSVQSLSRWLSGPVVLGASFAVAADGEIQQVCNCHRGRGMSLPMSMAPMPDYMPPQMPPLSAEPLPFNAPLLPAADPGIAPPPGTLGRSYSLPTKLIPAEKHPRIGMLEVRTTAGEVVVSDTNEFREADEVKVTQDEEDSTLWHVETKPLMPGQPHVYKVELVNGGVTTDVRYVRLLRGRILELTF